MGRNNVKSQEEYKFVRNMTCEGRMINKDISLKHRIESWNIMNRNKCLHITEKLSTLTLQKQRKTLLSVWSLLAFSLMFTPFPEHHKFQGQPKVKI